MLLHVFQCFKEIRFARELAGVAVASVEMQNDGVLGLKLAGILHAVIEEVDLVERLAAAVEPRVHAPAVRFFGAISGRNHQTVRLHAAINFRGVGANDQSGGPGPRRIAAGQSVGSFGANAKQLLGPVDLLLAEELITFEGEPDGFVEDQDIRKVRVVADRFHLCSQPVEPGAKLSLIGCRDGNAGGRKGFIIGLGEEQVWQQEQCERLHKTST